jgi:hypothetical protein
MKFIHVELGGWGLLVAASLMFLMSLTLSGRQPLLYYVSTM